MSERKERINYSRGNNLQNVWEYGRPYQFSNCVIFNITKKEYEKKDVVIWRDNIVRIIDSGHDCIKDNEICEMFDNEDVVIIDCGGSLINPGYIDWQLNGAYGVDFSNDDNGYSLNAGIGQVATQIVAHGVTSFCPTVVTGPMEYYDRNVPCYRPTIGGGVRYQDLDRSRAQNTGIGANALKLHLEGPVLAASKAGAHRLQFLRHPDLFPAIYGDETYRHIDENIGIVTMAAELPFANDMAALLSQRHKIAVSLGHSNCTVEEAEEFVVVGNCKAVTHLFNAQSYLNNRNPGVVGLLGSQVRERNQLQELDMDEKHKIVAIGIIADGIHVHRNSLCMAYACGKESISLVTDAISLAGLPEDQVYTVSGQPVQISAGRAVVQSTGVLVGSIAFLDECVRHYASSVGISIGEAAYAACGPAAKLLSLDDRKGKLAPGYDADIILLDKLTGHVLVTIVGGHCVYCDMSLW